MASSNIVIGPGSVVRPGSAFEILADHPLEELRFPFAPAYAAVCADRTEESFFALVSDPSLPPRQEFTEKLAALQLPEVLTPVAWGTVSLPRLPPHSSVTVFERPGGARVCTNTSETIKPFSADDVLHKALPPLVSALKVFAGLRVTHRGIRPSNLFFSGVGRQLMLGDAVCAPPGAAQPLFYETIESGMTVPHCRGAGTSADDLYSLGATLIYLLLGREPTATMEPQELLRQKIERGSFMTITSAARLPPEVIEIVRGLLNDDVRERWTIDDVENWMQGRRLKPRQTSPSGITATRPFEFNGHGHYTARAVAHAFAADPANAARAIRSNDFDIWLQRSLADDKRSVAVGAVRADAGDSRGNLAQDLRLTARTCMALDPLAPIRYGDIALAVDSFGQALHGAFQGRGSLQTLGEILLARLPQSWMSAQATLRPDIVAMNVAKPFDVLRRFAEDTRPGFGLERVLYELNPHLHCQSPSLVEEHVVNGEQILKALEAAAERGTLGDGLIDRHTTAFIAARSREISRDAYDLLNGTARQRALGTLSILAHLQAAYGPATVPAIGKMISGQAQMLVDMFHSRARRKRVESEIGKLSSKGALGELFWLLHSSAENTRDAQGFAAAQREYGLIQNTLAAMRREEHKRPQYAADIAGHFGFIGASFLAAGLALVGVLHVW